MNITYLFWYQNPAAGSATEDLPDERMIPYFGGFTGHGVRICLWPLQIRS